MSPLSLRCSLLLPSSRPSIRLFQSPLSLPVWSVTQCCRPTFGRPFRVRPTTSPGIRFVFDAALRRRRGVCRRRWRRLRPRRPRCCRSGCGRASRMIRVLDARDRQREAVSSPGRRRGGSHCALCVRLDRLARPERTEQLLDAAPQPFDKPLDQAGRTLPASGDHLAETGPIREAPRHDARLVRQHRSSAQSAVRFPPVVAASIGELSLGIEYELVVLLRHLRRAVCVLGSGLDRLTHVARAQVQTGTPMPSAAATISSQPAVVDSRSTAAVAHRAEIGLDAVKGLQGSTRAAGRTDLEEVPVGGVRPGGRKVDGCPAPLPNVWTRAGPTRGRWFGRGVVTPPRASAPLERLVVNGQGDTAPPHLEAPAGVTDSCLEIGRVELALAGAGCAPWRDLGDTACRRGR